MGATASVLNHERFDKYKELLADHSLDSVLNLDSAVEISNYLRGIGITDEADLAYLSSHVLTSHLNSAFVFIKPHANNSKVQSLVAETLLSKGMTIREQGEIVAEDIDSKRLIDNHYYSIASKATLLKPAELPVPVDKFEEFFGESYESALNNGKVFNAIDAAEYLGMNATELESVWRKAKDQTVKFGGGFYAAKLQVGEREPIYVFNAFFMSMRAAFVIPGSSIHFYVVEWDPAAIGISWGDFRASILGATDPTKSASTSLRGLIMERWEDLGLTEKPTMGQNGVHGSASPLEGLGEKCNWLGQSIEEDPFGRSLLHHGVPRDTIAAWCKDAQIPGVGSVFDVFEDKNVDDCYEKAKELI
jgi:hypothetical protein